MAIGNTKVIQVTNIAPQATKDQMQTLFGYLGKIEDIRLYPTIRDVSCPVQSRICYIKFMETSTVGIAQHMTNTVFIDRALIVIPVQNGEIPDEYYALEMTRNGTIVPGLHVHEPKLPHHVVNSLQGTGSEQVIVTTDPQLDVNNLPSYPPLPATYDSTKIEETRRTVCVLNIPTSATSQEVLNFFSSAGEVKYIRNATKQSDNSSLYLIEFSDQPSVLNALKLNDTEFSGNIIQVQHATQAIIKPQAKSNEAAQKEIEEAMSRFKEAQNMISASIEPVIGLLTKDRRSSRRSRSRSKGRRRRSRSRSARRSRSRRRRSNSRSRRSRSKERKRRSHSRKRSTSRSRRSRSKTSKTKRSRSKSPTWKRKSKDRESRSKDRRSRERSKDRRRSRDKKSKDRDREKSSKVRDRFKDREKSKEDRGRSKEKSKEREKSKENDKSKEKETKTRESNKKNDSVDIEKKPRDRSRSRSKYRSKSRDRKKRDRRRSRSRGRRRSPSPRRKKRSRTRSKDRRRDKYDKKDSRKDKERDRSRSRSKIPRNYDEEERGFEKIDKYGTENDINDKESSEKSDNMDISNSP